MSQPSRPDGSDPRVLTPSDNEEEVIVKSAHGGSGKAYHTERCANVEAMREETTKPVSVAKWKGYTKCNQCEQIEQNATQCGPQNTDLPPHAALIGRITPTICVAIRAALTSGRTKGEVADLLDIGKRTVQDHASGCDCEHNVSEVAFDRGKGWQVVDETPHIARTNSTRARLRSMDCGRVRLVLAETTLSAPDLAPLYGVEGSTIQAHANGSCRHEHGTPSVEYNVHDRAWHAVEGGKE